MDNDNETLVALLIIALIVFGIFRIVGDFKNLYEQTELKGQELSRWSKPEIEWGSREDDQEGWKRLKENDRA
ncbi:hypothetical protein ACSEUK_10765 [Pseudomonas aeruginosa]